METRDCITSVMVMPPGVEVEMRDYDAGVRLQDGTRLPLICTYRVREDGETELYEWHR